MIFTGRHWETGSIHNALNTQFPNTPYSEALLLGISGGIAFGYFLFDYEGHDPHVIILPRNTFDPLETLLERLGGVQHVIQSANATKAEATLRVKLDEGYAPLVLADMYSLPYNGLDASAMWGMRPVVVYQHDGQHATLADRSSQALVIDAATLTLARGRVKKDKHRLIALDAPDPAKLSAAIQKGIWQCISLFTDKPPQGTPRNFGLSGMQHLAEMLVNTRNKHSWTRHFESSERLWVAVTSLYGWVMTESVGGGAERGLYADFLDEAATILRKPALSEVAAQFRHSHAAWLAFGEALLPEDVPMMAQARQLLRRRHELYIEQGAASLGERLAISAQLKALQASAAETFPHPDRVGLQATLRDHVVAIHALEQGAVAALQAVMAG